MLLRKACPMLSGLQNVCCGMTVNFNVEPAEFIQVIHNGRGHWLTVSTIGTSHPDVHVYDSMYPSVNMCVKVQIAALLRTECPAIRLQFMAVQKQAGVCDCGLFAVAFATALAFGQPPGMYHFAQGDMRQHLYECFEIGRISMFPYMKLRRATESTVKSSEEVPVYCACKMPNLPDTAWIQCSVCRNRFHTESCIDRPSASSLCGKTPWYCSNCVAK